MADCFIKLDQVNGESGDSEFKDHIQVEGWDWSISQHPSGGFDQKSTRRAELSNFVFTHVVDSASPSLWARCARNDLVPTATIVMRRAGGSAQKYVNIKLKGVRILSVSLQHSAAYVIPLERVVLAYEQVEYEYAAQSAKGGDRSGRAVFAYSLKD